jgi:hypothetical protein
MNGHQTTLNVDRYLRDFQGGSWLLRAWEVCHHITLIAPTTRIRSADIN